MATSPGGIRMSDINSQGMESLQVTAILYEGSKKSEDECLQIPAAPEPEVTTDTSTTKEEVQQSNDKERRKPKKSIFGVIGNKLGEWFTPIGEDDEGDELS